MYNDCVNVAISAMICVTGNNNSNNPGCNFGVRLPNTSDSRAPGTRTILAPKRVRSSLTGPLLPRL